MIYLLHVEHCIFPEVI